MDAPFDLLPDRRHLSTLKWEYERARTGDPALLSFGTADMDFSSPKPILDAITQVAAQGHLGYPLVRDSYYAAIEGWLARTAGWQIDARACTATNVGIYTSIWTLLDALTAPGDEVIIQTPVHFCFSQLLRDNGRVAVPNPLLLTENGYTMDFDRLETLFTPKTKLFWLCNPHNPVGRAWREEELRRLGELCLRHGVTILSDDVYCGLVYPGHKYTPIASLSPELAQNSVICYSPSKSYNTTGVKFSFVVTENPRILQQYNQSLAKLDLNYGMNIFGLAVTEAAYDHCDEWLSALMDYVRENHRLAEDFVAEHMPGARVCPADSTYFAWVDLRCLPMSSARAVAHFEREAHILVNDGAGLGEGGEGFVRVNLACPRAVLREGLSRMERAYGKLTQA
ncbi:Mimosine amino transferase [uncultured Eubacteriales bacterium]|uniref:cysteine-S-conjugate beta-lyase n=1 Tax=uncultured Eubacteriales bacterium TaxID=172733 RepID=A0A212JH35_9FIRM|nr:Mimosine amino transferase [uncultured Eubacteriales bacterium]